MSMRWLPWFCFLAGFGLLALGAYAYFVPPDSRAPEAAEALEVTTDIDVGDCQAGGKRDVRLRMHNHSGRPIRVLGLAPC
jgi:hypothetical protein